MPRHVTLSVRESPLRISSRMPELKRYSNISPDEESSIGISDETTQETPSGILIINTTAIKVRTVGNHVGGPKWREKKPETRQIPPPTTTLKVNQSLMEVAPTREHLPNRESLPAARRDSPQRIHHENAQQYRTRMAATAGGTQRAVSVQPLRFVTSRRQEAISDAAINQAETRTVVLTFRSCRAPGGCSDIAYSSRAKRCRQYSIPASTTFRRMNSRL
jgi:hypothetical protein